MQSVHDHRRATDPFSVEHWLPRSFPWKQVLASAGDFDECCHCKSHCPALRIRPKRVRSREKLASGCYRRDLVMSRCHGERQNGLDGEEGRGRTMESLAFLLPNTNHNFVLTEHRVPIQKRFIMFRSVLINCILWGKTFECGSGLQVSAVGDDSVPSPLALAAGCGELALESEMPRVPSSEALHFECVRVLLEMSGVLESLRTR